MQEWGDLRFFLATARTGSTLGAARELGVNQTTVARRIAALETTLSVHLFDRNRDGYSLTDQGVTFLAQAERVEAEVEALEQLAAQANRHVSNVLRVTTLEYLADVILAPWLAEFIDLHPEIRVEVMATERCLDLHRGEADVAIRGGEKPPGRGFIVRKLAEGRWALYCSHGYATKHGRPARAGDLNDHLVIGAEGDTAKVAPLFWLADAAPRATVRSVCSSFSNALAAVKSGHGIAALPSWIGVRQADLIECFVVPNSNFGIYLITRDSLKDVPYVRAFTGFILKRLPALKLALESGPRASLESTPPAVKSWPGYRAP